MEERRKRGRPRLEDLGLERRDRRVSIRLTDEEFEGIDELSKKLKMSRTKTLETLVHYAENIVNIQD